MADVTVPSEEDDLAFLSNIYLDFQDLGSLDLFPDAPSVVDPPPGLLPGAPVALSPSQTMNDIERFLMEEGEDVGEEGLPLPDGFFADALFAVSDEGSVKSAQSNGDASAPETNVADGEYGRGKEAKGGEDFDPEANAAVSLVESGKETNGDDSEGKGGEDEDLLCKKQRRQMRNRDSAMKSRERKKMYVKDLEMKSKFLESECKRLHHALHCCAAENVALRQCLQKAKTLGAPVAKQESAVLFVESLLLGSLFWLMSIVCLFLMPLGSVEVIENASGAARSQKHTIGAGGPGSERPGPGLASEFIYRKRRCKATRTRMKWLCPLGIVLGSSFTALV